MNNNSGARLAILIVEDDALSAFYLSKIVEKISESLVSVDNGDDAIKFCRNNGIPDLILMDIQLPGMDGFQTTQEIRKFNKEVVIIAQTAQCTDGEQKKALECGCNDYISKPYTKQAMLKLISKHINVSV